MKISLTNLKEKLVKCATKVARFHEVSIQSCKQKKTAFSQSSIELGRLNLIYLSLGLSL